MKICAVAPPNLERAEFVRRVRLMDEVGFESLWLYETPFVAETFTRAGFIAACTERAKIGVGVVNPYTRHPGLTALGAATLDRLADGRLILLMGTGAGEWVRELFGFEQRKPVSDLLDAIRVVRMMLSGEKVSLEAPGFKIRNAQLENPPVRSRIPIYVAEGEKTDNVLLRASEAADGIYLGHGNRPIEYIRRDCQLIRKSAKGTDSLEVGAQFALRITDDPGKERDELRPWLAFYISNPVEGERLLEFGGFDTKIVEPIRKALKTRELIAEGRNVFEAFKVGNMAEAVKYVPDEVVDACSVIGNPGQCREKLGELEKAGLTFVALSFHARFDQTISRIGEILSAKR